MYFAWQRSHHQRRTRNLSAVLLAARPARYFYHDPSCHIGLPGRAKRSGSRLDRSFAPYLLFLVYNISSESGYVVSSEVCSRRDREFGHCAAQRATMGLKVYISRNPGNTEVGYNALGCVFSIAVVCISWSIGYCSRMRINHNM